MAGTFVPPWYSPPYPRREDVILPTFLWGATMSVAGFTAAKAVCQTYRSRKKRRRANSYLIMVWLTWTTAVVLAIAYWFYIIGRIQPRQVFPLVSWALKTDSVSLWFLLGTLLMWTIEIQCLTQILANRISLVPQVMT